MEQDSNAKAEPMLQHRVGGAPMAGISETKPTGISSSEDAGMACDEGSPTQT